jgi:predicted nucleic acid-binding protein
MDSIFDCLNSEQIRAFTSPVTLAECLVLPTRQNDSEKRQVFVKIDIPIAQHAAEIRVKYNLKLPDALQIATALVSNCEAFLTNDVQLKRVTELQVLVISELEV